MRVNISLFCAVKINLSTRNSRWMSCSCSLFWAVKMNLSPQQCLYIFYCVLAHLLSILWFFKNTTKTVLKQTRLKSVCYTDLTYKYCSHFRNSTIVAQLVCAFVEVMTGTLAALIVLPPTGSIDLHVCLPKALSDWYTLLHNPQPDYRETLHCTQEAVYPL